MSFTATRQRLAYALSDIEGVTGYERRPDVMGLGDAWPLLRLAERGPGDAFSGQWAIILILGGDEYVAQEKLDELLPLIVDAIDPVAHVQQAIPLVVATDAGDLHACEIRVESE